MGMNVLCVLTMMLLVCTICLGKDEEAVAEVLSGKRDIANAAWWGFDPDDSTEAIQSAIDSGVEKVIIPNLGKPWIVRPIFLRKNDQEVFFEKDVVILAKKGEFRGGGDCLFSAKNVHNLVLSGYGATLEMRKSDYWGDDYQGGQWRHGLSLRGCSNIKILGLTIQNTGGDSLYIGRGPDEHITNENIVVKDCVFRDPHRNGMLVITAKNLLIENCEFSNARGHSPMAGFSIEPNKPDEPIVDIHMRNCKIYDNDCYGIHLYFYKVLAESEPVSILLEGCHITGGHIGLHVSTAKSGSAGGKVVLRDCTIENTIKSGIVCREIAADSNIDFVFENIRMDDVSTHKSLPSQVEDIYKKHNSKRAPWHCRCHYPDHCNDTVPNTTSLTKNWEGWYPNGPIVLWAKSVVRPLQGGIEFRNCTVTEAKDVPVFVVAGTGSTGQKAPPEFKGWTNISGDIKANNPNGIKIDRRVPLRNSNLTINGKDIIE